MAGKKFRWLFIGLVSAVMLLIITTSLSYNTADVTLSYLTNSRTKEDLSAKQEVGHHGLERVSIVGKLVKIFRPREEETPNSTSIKSIQVDATTKQWMKDAVKNFRRVSANACGYSCTTRFGPSVTVRDADIVVFRGLSLPENPPNRAPGQLWVFLSGEPQIFHGGRRKMQNWDNLFNYSVTYLSTQEAGRKGYSFASPVIPRETPLHRNFSQERLQLVNAKGTYTKSKTVSALWFVSNCRKKGTFEVRSNRIKYALELSKYINVDAFTHKTGKMCRQELKHLAKFEEAGLKPKLNDYWFYLSFENSYCKDYISEKFWKVLSANTLAIPIAMGGTDIEQYTRIAPPNSFIHVDNFTSPKHLAEHLNYVVNNADAYNYYLEWRNHYELQTHDKTSWLCYACRLAHERPERIWRTFSKDFTADDCTPKDMKSPRLGL